MNYIRKKFVPSNRTVDEKVLSSIGESLRGYKRSLRMKYIKEGTTKEELYGLPIAESGNSEGLTRPYGVGDTMWYGFVDLCFSDKFQKYSEIGKKARAKQLHPHTNGSQSFAILRDQFERKHNREPGPIEWFIETRQNKKDKTFHDPITEQFVDTAKNIIKKKTGSSEVVFSESTFQAEDIAYRKLMGSESHGKVWGLGRGVTARDMRNLRHQAESPLIMKLMKKMQNLENQVDVLNAKLATQASATQPELSTHSQEASRHNTTRDHYISHNSPLSGNDSHEASRLDTVHDQDRSNESPKSGDALSISNVLGNQTHKLARSSKQGNNPRKTIVSGENALSKPSSGNVGLGSLNNGGQHRSPLQHNSTLLNAGGVGPKPMEPSSSIRERHDMGINKQTKDTPIKSSTMVQKVFDEQGTAKQQEQTVMNSLSRAQVDILVSTVVKNHPKEVHQYRSS